MARVTIEGSITPSTFLPRGARLTVERTGYINKLIRAGYVNVVAAQPAQEEVQQITDTPREAAEAENLLTMRYPEGVDVPSQQALKSVWQEFLRSQDVEFPDSATKMELIRIWNLSDG